MSRQDSLFQRLYNLPYGYTNSFHLFDSTKNSKSLLQRLRLQVKIPAHNGCVNSICWNETGKYLLSGSDDQHLCITHAYTHSILTYVPTGHRANIFSAKFLPGGDNKIISCSGDGIIIYSDLEHSESSLSNKFSCHFGTAYEIMTVPNDPHTFLSCGEDGTVRWFDLRTKTSCSRDSCKEDVLLNCYCAVTALAVNPVCPYQLAVGCADASVRIFDRRMLCTSATGGFRPKSGIQALMANFTVPEFTSNHRITSLGYSHDGQEILVSYSSDFIYLFDVRCSFNKDPKVINAVDKDSSKSARNKTFPSRPLMKRLRVRGDWSDTGPNARPESESRGEQQPRSLHASLMQRMSDVLTSMYNQRTRGQQSAAISSSSSHSEESEMDDTDEHEAEEGHSSSRQQTSASNSNSNLADGTQQPQVPTSSRSERLNDSIKEEEEEEEEQQDDDNNEEPERTNESDAKQQTPLQSRNLSDIDISTIKVSPSSSTGENHISSAESQSTVQTDATSEVLNLSLQNIKQELSLSKKALNETQEEKSVINGNSTIQDSDVDLQGVDVGNSSRAINNNESEGAIHSGDGNVSSHSDNESPKNICDNQQPMDFTPSAAQLQCTCDAATTSIELYGTDRGHESSSSAELSRDAVPDIFVATVPSNDEGSSTTTERQNAGQGEGQMTFMMEMDAWDVDSEDDTHSPSSYRRLGLEVPDNVSSAFKEDSEMTEEDLEKEEEQRIASLPHPEVINKYMGHRNARTMIKEATFWGNNFIMSGSDCGHIFVWDRFTSELVMLMEADHHVVNCLQPHPFDPILASSGIDYDIKIWAPLRDEPFFDEEKANEIIKRNKVMLEETRDTITVPASFMIRMLASLNHITSGSGWRRMARHLREGARRNR